MSNQESYSYTTLHIGGVWVFLCACLCMHVCSLLKDFPDIDFCVALLLCMLRSALQVVIPLIFSRIDETNDLTVAEQSFVFDLRL